MRRPVLPGSLLGFALLAAAPLTAGLVAQAPAGAADIEVTVGAGGAVRVRETYTVPGDPTLELRVLLRRCADLGAVRLQRSGSETTVAWASEGPWLVFRQGPSSAGTTAGIPDRADTLRFSVRYDVRLTGGRADVPLVLLAAPIPQHDGQREGTVRLRVRFAQEGGRVAFPHMDRRAPGEWGARYVAVPSFVTVSLGADAPDCVSTARPPGHNGGLVWRFLVLLAVMGAWVPIYLAWARRTGEGGQ